MSATEELRKCNKCGELLPVSSFYVRKDRPNETVRVCKVCAAKRQREYARANPEKIREISAKGREKHREEIRQRWRDYYYRNKDSSRYKESVQRTKEKHGEEWRKKDRERRRLFNEKWKHPCEKCGESRLYLIQFHHIDPSQKEFCIGAQATSRNDDVLSAEVKKCVCLCSNCHDEFHYLYGAHPQFPIEALSEYLGREVSGNV